MIYPFTAYKTQFHVPEHKPNGFSTWTILEVPPLDYI